MPDVDLIGPDEQVGGGFVPQAGNTRGCRDGPLEIAAAVRRRIVDVAIGIPHAELQRLEERVLQAVEQIGPEGVLRAVLALPLVEQLLQMVVVDIRVVDARGVDR